MDEEKLIQVSFQIPPSALDSLTRLTEQLRMLAEASAAPLAGSGSTVAASERMESDSFDPARFLALRQGADIQPKAVGADVSDIGDARGVSASVSQTGDAETASTEVRRELMDAEGAGDMLSPRSGRAAETDPPGRPRRSPPVEENVQPSHVEETLVKQMEQIAAVRAEAEKAVPDAPPARRDADRQIPDPESARAAAEERDLVLAAVQGEVSGGIEAPLGAGAVVQTQPEMPQSRWSDVTEELVVPGPAPLTAEAVSLAFERDGRRYDNGFPLY